jgi:hypothetical protein
VKTSAKESGNSLGWQGITIPLPDDWNLGAFSGDWDAGYVRAEGPNEAALELKWKHDRSSPSLKTLLKSYLKQLHKAAGRKGGEVPFKEKPKALPSVPQGSGVSQTFSWQTDAVHGVGAVWHCLECRRIILVQVTSPTALTVDSLARRIIPKIADHPEGEECRWNVYGMGFSVPKDYRLEKQQLMSGHLSLTFKHKGRTLVVERYGPASVVLKRDRLSEWATAVKPIYNRLKPYNYKKKVTEEADDHEGILLEGRRKSVKDLLLRVGLWFIRQQHPDALRMKVWRCEPSNRIYAVMAEARPREINALIQRMEEGVSCHEAPVSGTG